jgi:hypothetical protein
MVRARGSAPVFVTHSERTSIVKPEFSSSDLVLALAIVNGTAAAGARSGSVDPGDAKAGEVDGEEQAGRAATGGRTAGHGR